MNKAVVYFNGQKWTTQSEVQLEEFISKCSEVDYILISSCGPNNLCLLTESNTKLYIEQTEGIFFQTGCIFEDMKSLKLYLSPCLKAWRSTDNDVSLVCLQNFYDSFSNDPSTYQTIYNLFVAEFPKRLEAMKDKNLRPKVLHDLKSTSLYFGAIRLSQLADSTKENKEAFNASNFSEKFENWKVLSEAFNRFEKIKKKMR